MSKKKYRMKSKVQTYDIRDAEQYYGILELEDLLRKKGKSSIKLLDDEIRRTSSKQYVPGSKLYDRT